MSREWDLRRINREQEQIKQSRSGWKLSDYTLQPELEEEEEIALEDLPQFDQNWMEKDPIVRGYLAQKRQEQAKLKASGTQTPEQEKKDKDPFLSVLEHIWGTLIGDWNNNSDPLQDLTNMGAGLIPVVDQVLDVRDFAAHLYYMIFQRDYNNPMRWLGLGLTAIGAIPTVGSVVKGIGKIAIFQDGAKAIAKNAQPLLDGIRKINPEWGDIGKLRTAINSNWDKGVASGKEIWFEVLGNINTGIAGIPTPPKWIWGGTRLTIYKKQIQDIIGQINKLSNTKLDEALGVIRREVDQVLDELDRILRGGEPQLATEGVGNVNPSRIDANQPMQTRSRTSSSSTGVKKVVSSFIGKDFKNLTSAELAEFKKYYYTQTRQGLPPIVKRRKGKTSQGVPQIHIEEVNGQQIIKPGAASASTRLSDAKAMEANYAAKFGKKAAGNQIHHIVPDAIVRQNELAKTAYNRGIFDLDRATNLQAFPSTGQAGEIVHRGPHDKWSKHVDAILKKEQTKLIQKYGVAKLKDIPDATLNKELKAIFGRVEKNLRKDLNNIPKGLKEGWLKLDLNGSGSYKISENEEQDTQVVVA